MTKREALDAMEQGKKVSHRLFARDEYLYIDKEHNMYAEDGCRWEEGFFGMRHELEWQTDWFIYTS